jgi:hypothetical protein
MESIEWTSNAARISFMEAASRAPADPPGLSRLPEAGYVRRATRSAGSGRATGSETGTFRRLLWWCCPGLERCRCPHESRHGPWKAEYSCPPSRRFPELHCSARTNLGKGVTTKGTKGTKESALFCAFCAFCGYSLPSWNHRQLYVLVVSSSGTPKKVLLRSGVE